MKSLFILVDMLLWSLKLDREFLFAVPAISFSERLRVIFCKYLYFIRDRIWQRGALHQATLFGLRYRYNDRFGSGSIQRVFCSSWKLKALLPPKPVIVDVGANLGQFNFFSRIYLDAERIVSIEPLPACFELLVKNAEHPADCINMLVTEFESTTRFYVARDSQLSSTIRDNDGDYCDEIMIQGRPLEQILTGFGVDRIDLLKIDTEGSEMDVLRSAGRFLDKTDVVLVEMSIFRQNKGNIFTIGSFLATHGFYLHELIFAEKAHPADADGIFTRKQIVMPEK